MKATPDARDPMTRRRSAITVASCVGSGAVDFRDAPASRSIPSAFHRTCVLIADDDEATLEILGTLLESEGASVTSATRADEAEDSCAGAIRSGPIGHSPSDMDGLQFVRELRGNPRTGSWPAIALSGFGRAEDVERSKAGFNAHLPKPLSLATLADPWLRLSGRHSHT